MSRASLPFDHAGPGKGVGLGASPARFCSICAFCIRNMPRSSPADSSSSREDGADLLQAEAKLPQRHKAAEPGRLGNVVEPVPGMRVDLASWQQANPDSTSPWPA
jgi:hypothetical protein